MANENTKLVALDNGCYVGGIKKLNDNDIANAKNLKHKKEQKEEERFNCIEKSIKYLLDRVSDLEHEIKVLNGEE